MGCCVPEWFIACSDRSIRQVQPSYQAFPDRLGLESTLPRWRHRDALPGIPGEFSPPLPPQTSGFYCTQFLLFFAGEVSVRQTGLVCRRIRLSHVQVCEFLRCPVNRFIHHHTRVHLARPLLRHPPPLCGRPCHSQHQASHIRDLDLVLAVFLALSRPLRQCPSWRWNVEMQNGLGLPVARSQYKVPNREGLLHDHVCGPLFNPPRGHSGVVYSYWAPPLVTWDPGGFNRSSKTSKPVIKAKGPAHAHYSRGDVCAVLVAKSHHAFNDVFFHWHLLRATRGRARGNELLFLVARQQRH